MWMMNCPVRSPETSTVGAAKWRSLMPRASESPSSADFAALTIASRSGAGPRAFGWQMMCTATNPSQWRKLSRTGKAAAQASWRSFFASRALVAQWARPFGHKALAGYGRVTVMPHRQNGGAWAGVEPARLCLPGIGRRQIDWVAHAASTASASFASVRGRNSALFFQR